MSMKYGLDSGLDSPYNDYDHSSDDYGCIKIGCVYDIDIVKDHLGGLLEAIYVTGDVDQIDASLDEICAYLNVKMPKNAPLIEKISE